MWFGYLDIVSGSERLDCYDLWEIRDGYHVTITNRLADLPPWFRLHPTEICNRFVFKLYEQIERGDYPETPLDGPNLWRLKAGDRVAWVGADRLERRSVDGIFAILDCQECALLIGEGGGGGLEEYAAFGAPTTAEVKPEEAKRIQGAVKLAKEIGSPPSWAEAWRLG